MEAEKYKKITQALNDWYKKNARDLPWRQNPSLYKTVVSEFMLQQTQVSTVLPYFKKWIESFPSFESLAKADEQYVLKHWEGLGYYSRARNLKNLAETIIHLSPHPQTPQEWLQFKGVGPYTSRSISSIGLGYPAAAVDGNVIRILTRLRADNTLYLSNALAANSLQNLAENLLNTADPSSHNQAMMELGATVCFKNKPLCLLCPLQRFCLAFKKGNPESFPVLKRPKQIKVNIQRAWVYHKNKILLYQNPSSAKRLSSIWEIPSLDLLNLNAFTCKHIFTKKRAISNQSIEEQFFEVPREVLPLLDNEHLKWVSIDKLNDITLSGPHRKWLGELSLKF